MKATPSPDLAAAPGGELLPCPFCGSGVKLDERMDESLHSHAIVPFYSITCPECDVMGQSWEDRDEVIAHWNTRWNTRASPAAETAPDAGLVEALRGVVSGWEALPGGDYPPMRVQSWLVEDMKPAIDAARAALSRAGERHD